MEYKDLVVEKNSGIATITMGTPDGMNTITKMRNSLASAVHEIATDDEVKVIIVTGAGKAFSAGGDVKAMKARLGGTFEGSRYERLELMSDVGEIFPGTDKPVIAAINGAAVGAGFSLAMSCDIRIASEKAKFGSVFIRRALAPDAGLSYFLPRAIGTSKALELMLTGDIINADEARLLGIVSRVVPHDELMKVTNDLAARIAQQPPIAVELTKRLVYRSMIVDMARHVDWETYASQLCMQTEDFKESVLAFLEKRPPHFKGK